MSTSWANNLPEKSNRTITEFEFIHDPNDKNAKLGVGSFATVKLAKDKKNNILHALKLISVHPSKATASDLHNLRTEIIIHRKLDHPNIIKYYEYFQHGDIVYLVLDYAEKGNLYSYMHRRKALGEVECFKYFYQTCLAINHMHKNNFMHRDLKPENLLLDKDYNIKLCDFGWAAQNIYDKRTTFCGTYEYMAPEVVHKQQYDYRVDIWSLGILLFELLHKESPYKGRNLPEITKSMQNPTIAFSNSINPEAKDLILNILKFKMEERYSIDQILAHDWVRKHLKDNNNQMIEKAISKTASHSPQPSKVQFTPRMAEKTEKLDGSSKKHSVHSQGPRFVSTNKLLENKKPHMIDQSQESNSHIALAKPGKSPSYDNVSQLLKSKNKENAQDILAAQSVLDSLPHTKSQSPNNIHATKFISLNPLNDPEVTSSASSIIQYHSKSHCNHMNNRFLEMNNNEYVINDKPKILTNVTISPNCRNKYDNMIISQKGNHHHSKSPLASANSLRKMKSPQTKVFNTLDGLGTLSFYDNQYKKNELLNTDGSFVLSKNRQISQNIKKIDLMEFSTKESKDKQIKLRQKNKDMNILRNQQTPLKEPHQSFTPGKSSTQESFHLHRLKLKPTLSDAKELHSINFESLANCLTENDDSLFSYVSKLGMTTVRQKQQQQQQRHIKGNLVKEDLSSRADDSAKREVSITRLDGKNLREVDINRINNITNTNSNNNTKYDISRISDCENNSNSSKLNQIYRVMDIKRKNYLNIKDDGIPIINAQNISTNMKNNEKTPYIFHKKDISQGLSNWNNFINNKKGITIACETTTSRRDDGKFIDTKFLERMLSSKTMKGGCNH